MNKKFPYSEIVRLLAEYEKMLLKKSIMELCSRIESMEPGLLFESHQPKYDRNSRNAHNYTTAQAKANSEKCNRNKNIAHTSYRGGR